MSFLLSSIFPCFNIGASCTLVPTFGHALFLSLTIWLGYIWHFCFYKDISKIFLSSKCCQGGLWENFCHIAILGHSSPMFRLDSCYGWESWVKFKSKDWSLVICLFFSDYSPEGLFPWHLSSPSYGRIYQSFWVVSSQKQ